MEPAERNRSTYARPGIVEHYGAQSALQPAEAAILGRLDQHTRGRVLDLGVGGGRTTAHLLPLAREYVGIDYVPELVTVARRRIPEARIEQGDARDLSRFTDDSFDLCVFSFNGIDYVDHDDRLRVLAEVRRVLVPGGVFLFSTHNRDHRRFDLLPWQGRPVWERRTLRASARALRHTRTRRRMRTGVLHAADHAIVNDDAHGYSLLTYYIGADAQVRQLEEAGFTDVVVHDGNGVPGVPDDVAVWLHYAAVGCRVARG